jgi:hypothetical protein
MAHIHNAGSARGHSARGPRLAGPALACAARRASAHQSGHRSPGTRRGVAGGGATVAEVEQGEALEHPRLAELASACAARDYAARRASAHRSGHRSSGARRGAVGGGATVAVVEQGEALEDPRQRGHPPGMWVEAISHRSFLPTGKGGKPDWRLRSPTR